MKTAKQNKKNNSETKASTMNVKANVKTSPKTSTREKIGEEDIVQLIIQDHKSLKKLLKTLKNVDKSIEERQAAFEEFAPLFLSHIKPEEQTLYVYLKHDEKTQVEGMEGEVEHALADHLLESAKRTADDSLWSARVKVMSEMIEHHLTEEEETLLPEFKKNADAEERRELGRDYLKLKNRLLEGSERDVSEDPFETYLNH